MCVECLQITEAFSKVQTVAVAWENRQHVVSADRRDKKFGQEARTKKKGDASQTCTRLPIELVELRAFGVVRNDSSTCRARA